MDGDFLSVLSAILTVISVIVWIVEKVGGKSVSTVNLSDLAYGNGSNTVDLEEKDSVETFGNYHLSEVYYYESFTMPDFKYLDIHFLSKNLKLNTGTIINVVKEPNCFFIKVQYLETYQKTVNNNLLSEQRPKSVYFSMNYIAPRNNVLILGPIKDGQTKIILQQIAEDLKLNLLKCTF